jgi:hypothetical protein
MIQQLVLPATFETGIWRDLVCRTHSISCHQQQHKYNAGREQQTKKIINNSPSVVLIIIKIKLKGGEKRNE